MKVTHYATSGPTPGLRKQSCILGRGAKPDNVYTPLVYFQRPKWIKDDACWDKIVQSIRLQLPRDFEVK